MKYVLLIVGLLISSLVLAVDPVQQQLQGLLQSASQQATKGAQQLATEVQTQQTTTSQTPLPPTATPPASQTQAAPAPDNAVSPPGSVVQAVDTGNDPRDEAFAGMTNTILPLTPNQIRTLHSLFDATQRAAAEYPGTPPKPTSSSLFVSLSPGATPPVIRLTSGFVTSLVFLDRSGAPWPIKAYDLGDPSAFNIVWDNKGNTLLVQAITQYKTANLAVMLRGLNTPVMLTLLPGQKAVDYRVDLHVPGLGPNGIPMENGLPPGANPLLLNILSGIPPVGSKALQVAPSEYADVWLWHGKLYVRTRATILSPAWFAVMSSSDGTHAYKMPLTPMMIVSQNGKTVNLSIGGY